MAKTMDDLYDSREYRQEVLELLGQIPHSILEHNRNERAIDPESYDKIGRIINKISHSIEVSHKKSYLFKQSGSSVRGRNGILSSFSQNIGRLLVRFYTKVGDIVFDPFAGHNSRMELCWREGRHYFGCDISKRFIAVNREVRDILYNERDSLLFQELGSSNMFITEADSRNVPLRDCFADFTITSPPYWDLEFYGDEPQQLGRRRTYKEFLIGIQCVMDENFRVLKPDSFCCWNIGDFVKDHVFYNYHSHIITIGKRSGFTLHDIIIFDLGHPVVASFARQIMESKRVAKRHEYCIVFKKR